MQVPSFWIGTDAKTAEPCLELETFSIIHSLCQQNKKRVKVNLEHPNRCRKSRACPEGVLPLEPLCQHPRHWGMCAVKPSQQSCALWKSQPGCALLAETLPGQRGGAAKGSRFPFYQDFVTFVFDSTPSPRLHKHTGVELFKLHTVLRCSFATAQAVTKKRT